MAVLYDAGIFSIVTTGNALGVGWKLYFYQSGTTTPRATYPTKADADSGTNPNPNPMVANAAGRFGPIWAIDALYKSVLSDQNGTSQVTRDPCITTVSESAASAAASAASAAAAATSAATAAAATNSRTANTTALISAIRNNAMFPQPAFRCAANDVATITVPAANAASAITGGAATDANVPVTNTAKITWLCGTADRDVNFAYFPRGAWYSGGRTYQYVSYEFLHTGTQFEAQMLCNGLDSGTNFRIFVNDKISGTAAITVDGNNREIRVQFPASATRRIRIETCGGKHRGINVASTSEIAATGRSYPVVTIIGDSFIEGTGALYFDGEGVALLRALGFNPAMGGVGGTGILFPSTGGKVAWTDSNRLSDLALNGFTDIITGASVPVAAGVICMSVNDAGLASSYFGSGTTYQEAISRGLWTMIDHFQTQRAGKPLFVFGPTWPSEGPVLDAYRMRDAGQEACNGLANVWFIDRLGPGPELRKGTNLKTTTTGTTAIGSKIITALASLSNVSALSGISGAGIPAAARVMSVDSGTQVTIDVNCTANASGVAIKFANDQAAIYTIDADTTHPNTAGHSLDALWMAARIREIILTQLA